ncbi:IS1096 element passenger TnpR family protein [Nodosilinea sp. AN01ver1]|uniref:IS1096 element passenger TnpR family protein n=1 Tax=Nodosilinea sp. AN01ver1 TaxID=3423362 RepID=UPI003D31DD50
MAFNIRQLDNLDYDDAEPLLEDHIYGALEAFANSKTGKAYIKRNPEGGNWIGTFIEMAYVYGGYTLPKMTKANVQEVMEYILPRKLTLLEPSDTDGAIDELVAFWTFIDEVYKVRSAKAIAKYLRSIETQFPKWMFDPDRGGIAKSFLTQGMAAGFDMTTQAGLDAFRQEYNRNLPASPPLPPTVPMLPAEFLTESFEMTTPPADMQRAFKELGIALPAEGEMVNPMQLVTQFFGGLMKMDPDAAEQLMAELDDDPDSPADAAALRERLQEIDWSTAIALADADQATLKQQTITETAPGTILHDLQTVLDVLENQSVSVSGKLQHMPAKVAADLNQRLSNPIKIAMQRPVQKSYPNVHGLYLLLRATGLATIVTEGKKAKLVLNPAIYRSWQQLNPTEQYLSLLEVWFLRSHPEILGDERAGPLMMGDRCLQVWPRLTKTASATFSDYNAQDQYNYFLGFHNLALMEMFGLIAITPGQPEPGKGWRFKKITAEPWGKALMTAIGNANQVMFQDWPGTLDPTLPLGDLQPLLKPYFPKWQRCLALPTVEFRPGRHIFKVTLGKIWRRIAIAGEATLADFSDLIRASVDFDDDHLDMFTYKTPTGLTIKAFHPFASSADLFSDEVKIGNLPLLVGSTMEYMYDFGDRWQFEVVLEAVEPEAEPAPPKGFQNAKVKKTQQAKGESAKALGKIIESHGKAPEQYPGAD